MRKVYLVKFDAYHSNYIPYSLIYLSEILRRNGFKCKILHNIYLKTAKKDLNHFAFEILENKPSFVGFSVITGRSVMYSYELSKIIKENDKNIKIVWGGIHPTLLPSETLSEKYIDYVVSGEGEIRILNLVNLIEGCTNVDLDGISYKEDNSLIINPAEKKICHPSAWTRVDWSNYDLKPYINFDLGAPKLSYITSRGCPYNCGFCYNEALRNNRRYATKELDHVVSDIRYFKKKYNVKQIHFNDDNFFFRRNRAFEIIESMQLPYFAEARINYVDEEFAKNLKATRCRLLMCGGESGVNRILRYIRKGLTSDRMLEAAKLIATYKINSSWSFVFGFPTETRQEMKHSFEFMEQISKIVGKKICKPGIYLPYPGCFLYYESIKHGAEIPRSVEEWGKLERYNYPKILPWFDYEYYQNLLDDYIEKRGNLIFRFKSKLKNIKARARILDMPFTISGKIWKR